MQEPLIKKINNSSALVLYSSGLDSTYNVFKALEKHKMVFLLFFNYGQKSYTKELEKVKTLANKLNLKLITIDLDFYKDFNSTIINSKFSIPLYNEKINKKPKEWVANRNGVLVNIAAAIAEDNNIKNIIIGINKEEAINFPDNSVAFLNSINILFKYSTLNKVKLSSYTLNMDKTLIFKKLKLILDKNEISYDIIWSCYNSLEKMCGKCQSCVRLKRAIINNKLGGLCQDLFLT